jgi:hypothetical protein
MIFQFFRTSEQTEKYFGLIIFSMNIIINLFKINYLLDNKKIIEFSMNK